MFPYYVAMPNQIKSYLSAFQAVASNQANVSSAPGFSIDSILSSTRLPGGSQLFQTPRLSPFGPPMTLPWASALYPNPQAIGKS